MNDNDQVAWNNAPLSAQPLPDDLLALAKGTLAIAAPSDDGSMAFHAFAPGQVLAFGPGRDGFVAFERLATPDATPVEDALDGLRADGHPDFTTRKACSDHRSAFARAFVAQAPADIRARMRAAAPGRSHPSVTVWHTAADALAHLFREPAAKVPPPPPAPTPVTLTATARRQPVHGVLTIYDATIRHAASTGREYLTATATGRINSAEPFVVLVFAPECIDALRGAVREHGPMQAAVAGRWDRGSFIANAISTERNSRAEPRKAA